MPDESKPPAQRELRFHNNILDWGPNWRPLIAFGLRCAERIEPVFAANCPRGGNIPPTYLHDLIQSTFSLTLLPDSRLNIEAPNVYSLTNSISRCTSSVGMELSPAIHAVSRATQAFQDRVRAMRSGSNEQHYRLTSNGHVLECAMRVYELLQPIIDINAELEHDFGKIKYSDSSNYEGRPVHTASFGLLWPNGRPQWSNRSGSDLIPDDFNNTTNADESNSLVKTDIASKTILPTIMMARAQLRAEIHRQVHERYDEQDLEMTLDIVDVRLSDICEPMAWKKRSFKLIKWFEQRGRLPELVELLAKDRQQVPEFQRLLEKTYQLFPQ